MKTPDGWDYAYVDEIDGTNAALKRDPADMKILRAGVQTAGRGRLTRVWSSPLGNLYTSLCFKVENARAAAGFSFVTAIALCEALRALDGKSAYLCKWPNDVLADGAKISGILLELIEKGGAKYLIVGIGVNVESYPQVAGVLYHATSLRRQGCGASCDALAETLYERFDRWKKRYEQNGLADVLARWTALARGIGEQIAVSLADRRMTGIFSGLDKDGALLLNADGNTVRVTAGDVFFGDNEERKDKGNAI